MENKDLILNHIYKKMKKTRTSYNYESRKRAKSAFKLKRPKNDSKISQSNYNIKLTKTHKIRIKRIKKSNENDTSVILLKEIEKIENDEADKIDELPLKTILKNINLILPKKGEKRRSKSADVRAKSRFLKSFSKTPKRKKNTKTNKKVSKSADFSHKMFKINLQRNNKKMKRMKVKSLFYNHKNIIPDTQKTSKFHEKSLLTINMNDKVLHQPFKSYDYGSLPNQIKETYGNFFSKKNLESKRKKKSSYCGGRRHSLVTEQEQFFFKNSKNRIFEMRKIRAEAKLNCWNNKKMGKRSIKEHHYFKQFKLENKDKEIKDMELMIDYIPRPKSSIKRVRKSSKREGQSKSMQVVPKIEENSNVNIGMEEIKEMKEYKKLQRVKDDEAPKEEKARWELHFEKFMRKAKALCFKRNLIKKKKERIRRIREKKKEEKKRLKEEKKRLEQEKLQAQKEEEEGDNDAGEEENDSEGGEEPQPSKENKKDEPNKGKKLFIKLKKKMKRSRRGKRRMSLVAIQNSKIKKILEKFLEKSTILNFSQQHHMSNEQKMNYYFDYCHKLNTSNGIAVVNRKYKYIKYKCYLEPSFNNVEIVKQCIRKRWWWTIIEHPFRSKVHFYWTGKDDFSEKALEYHGKFEGDDNLGIKRNLMPGIQQVDLIIDGELKEEEEVEKRAKPQEEEEEEEPEENKVNDLLTIGLRKKVMEDEMRQTKAVEIVEDFTAKISSGSEFLRDMKMSRALVVIKERAAKKVRLAKEKERKANETQKMINQVYSPIIRSLKNIPEVEEDNDKNITNKSSPSEEDEKEKKPKKLSRWKRRLKMIKMEESLSDIYETHRNLLERFMFKKIIVGQIFKPEFYAPKKKEIKESLTLVEPMESFITNRFENAPIIDSFRQVLTNLKLHCIQKSINLFDIIPPTFYIKSIADVSFKKLQGWYMNFKVKEEKYKKKGMHGNLWIVKNAKPSLRSKEMFLVKDFEYIRTMILGAQMLKKEFIIQKYIENPIIIKHDGKPKRFDLRFFVLVTWVSGTIKVYFYQEGYAKLYTNNQRMFKYKNFGNVLDVKSLNEGCGYGKGKDNRVGRANKFCTMDFKSITKEIEEYWKNKMIDKFNKSSFKRMNATIGTKKSARSKPQRSKRDTVYFSDDSERSDSEEEGDYEFAQVDFKEDIMPKIKKSCQELFRSNAYRLNPSNSMMNFQIFSVDFVIDSLLKPWLIDVRSNPNFNTCGQVLLRLIPDMFENAFKIAVDPIFPPAKHNLLGRAIYVNYFSSNRFELIYSSK